MREPGTNPTDQGDVDLLVEVARRTNEGRSLEDILAVIQQVAAEKFGANSLALYLVDRGRGEMRMRASFLRGEPYPVEKLDPLLQVVPLVPASGSLFRSFERGRLIHIPRIDPDVIHSQGTPVDRAILEATGLRWFAHLPLIVEDAVIGLVTWQGPVPQRMSPADRRFCERLAAQVAGAVRMLMLLEDARAAKDELDKLAAVSRLLTEASSLDEIVETVVGYVRAEFDIDGVILMLVDERRRELYTVHSTAPAAAPPSVPAFARDLRVSLQSDSALARVLERGRPLYARRILRRADTPGIDAEIVSNLKLSGYYAVPLVVQGKSTGLMLLCSYDRPTRLTADMRRRIDRYCEQVAGGVRGAALREEVERASLRAELARTETERLASISREVNQASDLDTVVERLFKHLTAAMGVRDIVLQLVDESKNELYPVSWTLHHAARHIDFVMNLRVPLVPNSGTLYRTYRRQKPMYVPEVRGFPSELDRRIVENLELESLLQVPLVLQKRTIGILWLTLTGNRRSREEIEKIVRLCDQVTGAIHSSSLLKQTQRARLDTELLAILARRANAGQDLSSILEAIASVTDERFETRVLGLYSVNREDEELVLSWIIRDGRSSDLEAVAPTLLTIPLQPESGTIYRTFLKRRPFYINRVSRKWLDKSPRDAAFIDEVGGRWLAQVPLLVENEVVGILAVSGHTNIRLHSEDLEFLERVGAQVAGAVRTVELLQRTAVERRRAEQASEAANALRFIAQQAGAKTNLSEMIDLVMDFARTQFGLSYFGFFFLDEREEHIIHHRSYSEGVPDGAMEVYRNLHMPLSDKRAFTVRTFYRRKTLYLPRVRSEVTSPAEAELLSVGGLQSILIVPLIAEDETLGLLIASEYRKRLGLNREEIQQLEAFCNQVAGTIRTTRLLEQTRAARAETEIAREEAAILADLSRKANETASLAGILRGVAEVVRQRFGANSTVLWTTDSERRWLRPEILSIDGSMSSQDGVPEILRKIPLTTEGGSLYRTLVKKRPLHMHRVSPAWLERSPFAVDRAITEFVRLRWLVQIPLIVADEAVGVLAFSARSEQRRLSSRELAFCERLGAQLAGAVRTVQLLNAVRRERELADTERERSEALLRSILPDPVAEELKTRGEVQPLLYDGVSVLFTDFVGFTRLSQRLRPDELVRELDGCFSQFDQVVKHNHMEKLKTIGDAYMCAAGVPVVRRTHAVDACLTALEFRAFMLQMAEVKQALGHEFWQLRIGIHSGPVTAGVIGTEKFAYDIWGDTVNTASRMESSGEPTKINVSEVTRNLTADFFDFEDRGLVEAKGKGRLRMFFLLRIKPELSADSDGLVPNAEFRERYEAVAAHSGTLR